jgi:hypothetical protein
LIHQTRSRLPKTRRAAALKGLKEDFGFELPPDMQEEIEARLAELLRNPLA